VLRSSNIHGNRLAYDDNVYVNVNVPDRLKVRKADVLICVRNGSRNLIGKCAYIEGQAIGETFGAFMSVFRSPYNDYVFHVLQSDNIHRQIEETIGATINQLTNKNLNSFEIPFPKLEEQKAISLILSDMDDEIQELERGLEKYKKLKLGMMQSLLTGKVRLA
jgi:type I restriction enzyme S subunit